MSNTDKGALQAQAVDADQVHLLHQILIGKRDQDPTTGKVRIYDANGSSVIHEIDVAVADDGTVTLTPTAHEFDLSASVDPVTELSDALAMLANKKVIDPSAATTEVYATDGVTLLVTLTKQASGSLTEVVPS